MTRLLLRLDQLRLFRNRTDELKMKMMLLLLVGVDARKTGFRLGSYEHWYTWGCLEEIRVTMVATAQAAELSGLAAV